MARRRRAFTLVELIVVVVILGLLAAVGAFAYNQVTESSRKHAAHLMAVHFAHDADGVAAAQQQPVGALHDATDEGLADVGTDTTRSAVVIEYGTVNATTKDVVVGVSYNGYCTPVLFTGSPSKGHVGTTVKTTGSCKTDDGVPPAGDPILNPPGGTGGSDGSGGSGGSGGTGGSGGSGLDTTYTNMITTRISQLDGVTPTGTAPTSNTGSYYTNVPSASDTHPAVDASTEAFAGSGLWLSDSLRDTDGTTGVGPLAWDTSTTSVEINVTLYPHVTPAPVTNSPITPATANQATVRVRVPAGMPTPVYNWVQVYDATSGSWYSYPNGIGWGGTAPDANGWVQWVVPLPDGATISSATMSLVYDTTTAAPAGKISEMSVR